MSNIYGYIRVSSKDQNENRQLIALNEVGVERRNIYLDKKSGKDFVRHQYKKLLRKLKKMIYSISRTLTASNATIKKFYNNEGYLPKRKASTLWCWICPYLILAVVRLDGNIPIRHCFTSFIFCCRK